jgi:WD40 repeat protein
MASASGIAKAWDLKGNRVIDIGQHDGPVRDIYHVPGMNDTVVTSGWDGFIKFWDTRTPKPVCE